VRRSAGLSPSKFVAGTGSTLYPRDTGGKTGFSCAERFLDLIQHFLAIYRVTGTTSVMKNGRLCLALAAILALPLVAASAEIPVNVMTFNIRYGTAHDRQNNWPNRQDMTVRMLKKYDADIVGTQEILDFQADYINQWIPGYRWFGPERMKGGSPERCAILHKWREFIPLEMGTFWLSETPEVFGSKSWESNLPRIATWARFLHLDSETSFYFYNTHFDHISQQARMEGMKVVLEHINRTAGDRPVIFVGDFNVSAEQNEVYDIAIKAGFNDAWTKAAKREGPVTTWNAFQPLKPEADRRIDWILTRGAVQVDYIETITYSESGRWVSDHFPVFARLRLQTGK
jgi:endonuclease/exonuclease/phosphatase family metal-dependent hydrolase